MCGRFVSSSPPDELAKYFEVEAVTESVIEPSYNVAPSNDVYVVVETGGVRRLETFHWGLVPFWAKDPSTGNKMINARAESVAEKNAYRHAFKKRRCIIPVDGFYEWRATPDGKMAREITESLRRLDPADPLRYDFALSHLGILGDCPGVRHRSTCAACPLYSVCRAGSESAVRIPR